MLVYFIGVKVIAWVGMYSRDLEHVKGGVWSLWHEVAFASMVGR